MFETSARHHNNVCPWRYHATLSQTTSFAVHISALNWSLTVFFFVEIWSGKGQNVNLFYLPAGWPASFLPTGIILWWRPYEWCYELNLSLFIVEYLQSSFRLPIVKILVLVIFYCFWRPGVIINYWLKMFILRNTAKTHMILGY